MRGGVACYAAQAMAPIDAEIGPKDHLWMETGDYTMADPHSRLKDYILDENLTPVARMRLFSGGINRNTRLLQQDAAIGDRACLACGNCVDACPVVADTHRFVFLQNQRTSMALENMVADECRRCYRCIQACPQVAKEVKDYAGAFRRGEKIVHLLIAITILLLAASGITVFHYGEILPPLETALLTYGHRVLGLGLICLPLLYLIIDKHHLLRLFRKISSWSARDGQWLRDLVRHVKDPAKQALPYTGEFNPGQKAWYLFISVMIPFMTL